MSDKPANKKLYYYTNYEHFGWFANPEQFHKVYPRNGVTPIRVCADVEPPAGYRRTGKGLANDPVERIPKMKDLVKEL